MWPLPIMGGMGDEIIGKVLVESESIGIFAKITE